MSDGDFELRLDRVTRAAEAVKLLDNPELQAEAFHYLLDSGPAKKPSVRDASPDESVEDQVEPDSASGGNGNNGTKPPRKKSTGKKQSFTFDKDLNIYVTSGVTSTPFKALVAKHYPKTQEHRAVVAVYWLKKERETPAVKIDQVYTVFKTMEWPVPADLANTLAQAGTKGFIDSKKRDDIGITTHGENLVEHVLKPETSE